MGKVAGKTLFWPCTGPVMDCSAYVQEVKIAMSVADVFGFVILVLNAGGTHTPCRWQWGSRGSFVLCGS